MPLLLNGIKQGLYKGGVKQGLYKGGVKILPEETAPEVFTPVCMVYQSRTSTGLKIHFADTFRKLFLYASNLDALETYVIPAASVIGYYGAVRATRHNNFIYVMYSSTALHRFTRNDPVGTFTVLKPQEITDDYATTNWLLKDLFVDPINNEICIVVSSSGKTRRLFTSSDGNSWTKIPENGSQTASYCGAVIYPWYPNEVRGAGYLFTGGTMQWYDFATKTITNTLPKGLTSSANTTNLTNYNKELGLFYPISGDGFVFDFKNGQKFTTKAAIFGAAAANPGGFDRLQHCFLADNGDRILWGTRAGSSVASERNQASSWRWLSAGVSQLIARVSLPEIPGITDYGAEGANKKTDGTVAVIFGSGVTRGILLGDNGFNASMSPTLPVQILSSFWLT